jgi:hypothetical protein
MTVWKVEDAQGQLLQLIDDAIALGPQTIARDEEPLVVVVASNEWSEMQKTAEFIHPHQIETSPSPLGHLKNFVCG